MNELNIIRYIYILQTVQYIWIKDVNFFLIAVRLESFWKYHQLTLNFYLIGVIWGSMSEFLWEFCEVPQWSSLAWAGTTRTNNHQIRLVSPHLTSPTVTLDVLKCLGSHKNLIVSFPGTGTGSGSAGSLNSSLWKTRAHSSCIPLLMIWRWKGPWHGWWGGWVEAWWGVLIMWRWWVGSPV